MWVTSIHQATTAASQLLFGFMTFNYLRTFLRTTQVLVFDNNLTITEHIIRMGDMLHPRVFSHDIPRTDTELTNFDTAFCQHSYTFNMHQKASSSLVAIIF